MARLFQLQHLHPKRSPKQHPSTKIPNIENVWTRAPQFIQRVDYQKCVACGYSIQIVFAEEKPNHVPAKTQEKRLVYVKGLIYKVKNSHEHHILQFFSHENFRIKRKQKKQKKNKNKTQKSITNGVFDQNRDYNRRDDRWLPADFSDVSRIMSIKFCTTLIVLNVVSNHTYIKRTYIFPHDLRNNVTLYVDVLEMVVKHCMDETWRGTI